MKTFEGKLVAEGIKVGIVCAQFNEFIVSKLLSGCEDVLLRHGVQLDDIAVAWVPGAFKIPLIASRMAKSGRYDAVIALGAVIRGSTSHYDYVCSEVSKGVASVALNSGIPIMFGFLTTDTIVQAIERAGTKSGNFREAPVHLVGFSGFRSISTATAALRRYHRLAGTKS